MSPAEDNLWRNVGELIGEVRAMRAEQNIRHTDNVGIMQNTNHRVEHLENRVNSLWAFRSRIILVGGAVVTVAGFVVHLTSDWIGDILRGTGHG